ncbi:hypothetical protein TraAM80_02032 [Trypanosoma rangeli]|uniref:tRNA ligase phosphodiesterase domain-containing protein n=1 Tax=Trypanosoma rangeli TaxID=5698 RepID=A0A3R7KU04_TRYRA|nr:uncharacterized protein TraAM80_02032 [Trypanosoma rangeli]RNF09677.1 hypothetical protein TraAM80_02032 [Trypanosoma rangeli]|eukprot:RNF09677.1 hypothetical protein TraAM80_02032 [Trypanosoma rangeli]
MMPLFVLQRRSTWARTAALTTGGRGAARWMVLLELHLLFFSLFFGIQGCAKARSRDLYWKKVCNQRESVMGCSNSLEQTMRQADADNECESILSLFPRPVEYAAIQIASPEQVLRLVPPEMLDGKQVQTAFHVTTLYIGRGGCKDPVLLQQLVKLRGASIQLTLVSVVSDAKGTAIAVRNEGEFPCKNAHPHITVANAPGVPAVYSNELLDDSHASDPCRAVVPLPAGTCISGTFGFAFH